MGSFQRYLVLSCLLSLSVCQYVEEEEFEEEEAEEADVVPGTGVTLDATHFAFTGNSTFPISNATMNRVIGQINNVWNSVETLNITGVVDQALGINNNTRIRTMVNSIMEVVFCNPFFANFNNCGHVNTKG